MINKVIDELEKRGYKAETKVISKDGIEKSGIIIGEGTIRPIIYPSFKDGASVNDIVDETIESYKQFERSKNFNFNLRHVMSWDYAKDHLTLCLRRKTTENILKQDFLDLEMCVRVLLPEDRRNPFRHYSVSSYVVKPGFFPDIEEEEIFNRTFQNLKKDAMVNDMVKIMMGTGLSMELIQSMGLIPAIPMIVISNKTKFYGASAICDTEILSGLARDYESNLLIIPSSIHECIVIPINQLDMEVEEATEIVKAVNTTEVPEEEILSDHVYIFNRETSKITW